MQAQWLTDHGGLGTFAVVLSTGDADMKAIVRKAAGP
jgi:hypothetical protein